METFEQLAHHLAQLVGVEGVRALLARSVALSSPAFPWLADIISVPTEDVFSPLRAALEHQAPQTIRDGHAALLSNFLGLLGRLVGQGLVERVVHDVWPDVFPLAVKEPT
jgi:hypothetical protein